LEISKFILLLVAERSAGDLSEVIPKGFKATHHHFFMGKFQLAGNKITGLFHQNAFSCQAALNLFPSD
jgi:hypothetical protein